MKSGPLDPDDEHLIDDADLSGAAVFEGVPLRFKKLSLEEIDELSAGPSPLTGVFRIRLARNRPAQDQAADLVRRRYESRGYDVPRVVGDPNLFTFVAYDEGHVVGTVGLRLDSGQGLSAESLYPAEISGQRNQGERLCEFTRLAVNVGTVSKPVLAALFHTAYLFASEVRDFTSAVIEVNPRHVVFYQRALDFEIIGEERLNARVNAPAVLMKVTFANIARGLHQYSGRADAALETRTLYPWGFPPGDVDGILARLRVALGEAAQGA